MGKKYRRIRSAIKSELRKNGWYENEFGELTKRTTKAEARARLLEKKLFLRKAEQEIIQLAVERATRDIIEIEDRRVFADIERALETHAD